MFGKTSPLFRGRKVASAEARKRSLKDDDDVDGKGRHQKTFHFRCGSVQMSKSLIVYILLFSAGFITALALVAFVFEQSAVVESGSPMLSRGKSAAYVIPFVDDSALEPIETFGSDPSRDWFGHLQKKQTGFVRTKALSEWLRGYLKFEDSGPPYKSVECITSFAQLIDFDNGNGDDFNNAILRYLNRHSLYNAKSQKQYAVRSKINKLNNGGISQLNGQYGIMAKMPLKKHQCVGQYVGDEMFRDEFSAIYEWKAAYNAGYFDQKWYYYLTIDESWHLRAALELHRKDKGFIADGIDTSNDTQLQKALNRRYGSNRTYAVDGYFEHKKEMEKSHIKRQLEAGEWLQMSLVAYINDARSNMSSTELSQTDIDQRLNTEFVNCIVNGGPVLPFLVALKDIPKGQQLFNYYGPKYEFYEP